jgi:signal transduction histidine kinase
MTFRQKIKSIPYWAYLLVILVIAINLLYLYYKYQIPEDGCTYKYENGHIVYDYIKPGWPDEKAGIKTGDILLSVNSIPIEEWSMKQRGRASDTLILVISRNNRQITIPCARSSYVSHAPGLYWSMFVIMLLFSCASLYILFKKPYEPAARLFFIYIQLFIVIENTKLLPFQDPLSIFATAAFLLSGSLIGPVLIHFILLFPRPAKIYGLYPRVPLIIYTAGFLLFIGLVTSYVYAINTQLQYGVTTFSQFNIILRWWKTLTFFLAVTAAIYQFKTIKDTLARNQLRIIIIGAFFCFITPITQAFFYNFLIQLSDKTPFLIELFQGIGSLIMICCILIAIFRFRIWDLEIFIRKTLLYIGATLIVIFSYLLLIFLVNQLAIRETNITRFLIFAISVVIFLVLRDWFQRMIDRIFQREAYDTATVVSDFEEKLAGIYRDDELKLRIGQCLDEIFHFKSLTLNLKRNDLIYEPAFVQGADLQILNKEFAVTSDIDRMLRKSKVFSPGELDHISPGNIDLNGELIVPLVKEDQPYGFFICGQKKSEKMYSMQDIRVLSLIAKRVIALFQTANLYQKDLDRQLMLERERARIAKDMHDDIGAGLTKIAMISEARAKVTEPDEGSNERLTKVATTARDMINRLNVIVWALNPRYDNLDSLISYARRYFGEFLENFGVGFKMEVPDSIPDLSISPDYRRNAFYAWQEAIHNAVKHSHCSEINIFMKIDQNKMLVTITDNGKGFNQANAGSGGNGLLNMKRRAEDLGGSFEIKSFPGGGTTVLFSISLNQNTTKV